MYFPSGREEKRADVQQTEGCLIPGPQGGVVVVVVGNWRTQFASPNSQLHRKTHEQT